MSLTPEEVAAFRERGHVCLRAAFPPERALELQDRMWDELRDDFGIVRDDRRTWHQPRASLRRAKWDPLQSAVATERLLGSIASLLGPVRWQPPSNWGVVLVTFPDPSGCDWTVPAQGWHFDFDLDENARTPAGVFVLTFFSNVEPRGGGTLVVEGSHRLLRRFHAGLSPAERCAPHRRLRKRALAFDPWLRALTGVRPVPRGRVAYFMEEEREVQGVPVRVVELTGRAGDAVLCDPLILHAAAPNHAAAPRFMRSQRICADGGQPEEAAGAKGERAGG